MKRLDHDIEFYCRIRPQPHSGSLRNHISVVLLHEGITQSVLLKKGVLTEEKLIFKFGLCDPLRFPPSSLVLLEFGG